ncbi:MAG: M14 family zinc carboxypeptidase [Eubacteriales bacterium]|nr:M14 family zinc carboxypeptidase [Eubacteriales bacterium]
MNIKKLNYKNAAVKGLLALSAAALLAVPAGSISRINAYADVIYSPGIQREGGPGGAVTNPPAAESNASAGDIDMSAVVSINSFVPAGYFDMAGAEVPGAVVANEAVYSYGTLQQDIMELKSRYSSLMSFRSLGQTADNRDVYEIIVGNENAGTHILINAALHGREYITSNLVMKQLEYILYGAANGGSFDGTAMSTWLQNVCFHFVPMDNPDGVTISQYGPDGLNNASLKSLVQNAYATDVANDKTHLDFASYLRRWKANGRGVDLNENFSFAWNQAESTLTQPSAQWYKGNAPESEAESQMLVRLLNSRHYKAVLNYHAMGNVIYWDFTENQVREKCRQLMNNVRYLTGYPIYTDRAGGGMKEYICTKADPLASVTIEVGRTASPVDPAELPEIWAKNKLVPLYTMKWAAERG